jgi:uncharacterized protein YjbI with pentapeptide repeats
MANKEHFEIIQSLKKDPMAWNEWRKANPRVKPDLVGARIKLCELEDPYDGYLSGIDFHGADLRECDLESILFSNADFSNADLSNANLSDSNLTNARLLGAKLDYCNLANTDFSEAIMGFTSLHHTNLSLAKGLALVQHSAPSVITLETIAATCGGFRKGKSDLAALEFFLRQAGGTEAIIQHFISSIALLHHDPDELQE